MSAFIKKASTNGQHHWGDFCGSPHKGSPSCKSYLQLGKWEYRERKKTPSVGSNQSKKDDEEKKDEEEEENDETDSD